MARPTKFDQPTADVIMKAVAAGLPNETAAELAGVSERTLYEWKRRGKAGEEPFVQIVQDIKRGQAEAVVSAMKVIREAAERGTWTAAAWWLERRHPDLYGCERKRIRELEKLVAEIIHTSAGSSLTAPVMTPEGVKSDGKRGKRSRCSTR